MSYLEVANNVCLSCHLEGEGNAPILDDPPPGVDGHTETLFLPGDASNLGGNNPDLKNYETSHNWSAPTDNMPRFGARAPTRNKENKYFYSRYGTSTSRITCSRCHLPHDYTDNPQLLVLGPDSADKMCLACHQAWDLNNHGWLTHPVVENYNAIVAANPDKFRNTLSNKGNADVQLVAGGVSCTSCHGAHFADSDASTTDGPGGNQNKSDGKLLRGDGPGMEDKASLCQTCHTYQKHGNHIGEQLGCLTCHSGHSYDPDLPNYYVLRKATETTTYNAVTGLEYSSPSVLVSEQKYTFWNDRADGEAEGYCEKCHGDAKDIGLGAGDYHVTDAVCTDCHRHSGTTDASFSADCDACHNYPPVWGSHQQHINSDKMTEQLGCGSCHSTSPHMNDFSEVRFDASEPWVAGGTYNDLDETSRYTQAGGYNSSGLAYVNCDNLYCHSNAAPLDKDNVYQQPVWGGASVGCDSCHDDGGVGTGLSDRHGAHTDVSTYAFSCNKCHSATVSDNSTISDAEQHVDAEKDVVFSASGDYDTASNECSNVYCHTDGRAEAAISRSCASVAVSCHWRDTDDDGIRETDLGNQITSVSEIPDWSDTAGYNCSSCHKGRPGNKDCFEGEDCPGSEEKHAQMDSNGHFRLANDHWIRKYECYECHYLTTDEFSELKLENGTHVNETVDVYFGPKSKIVDAPDPSYNSVDMTCLNIYCHSDGTDDPKVRDFPWDLGTHAKCDSCHGHEPGDTCSTATCHTDGVPEVTPENQWKMATPMYENDPDNDRPNSHLRHLESEFACENCHRKTVVGSCNTIDCHDGEVPSGQMSEVGHIIPQYHVNKERDVFFKDGGSYVTETKTCKNTACHNESEPEWGESRNGAILCLTCHGTTEADIDGDGIFEDLEVFEDAEGVEQTRIKQTRINKTEWMESGHGRTAAMGNYPTGNNIQPVGNPPADLPGNACWYCHDNEILHNDVTNPYRLKEHPQFEKRFEKECVYCHMEQKDEECWGCHDDANSLSVDHQLSSLTDIDHAKYAGVNQTCLTSNCHLPQEASQCNTCHENPAHPSGATQLDDNFERTRPNGKTYVVSEIRVGMSETPYAIDHIEFRSTGSKASVSCMATSQEWAPNGCHTADAHIHNTGAGIWTDDQKEDVKNQYVMMGVCLQCHDDDDNNRCNTCHTWPEEDKENSPYLLGYDPGTGFKSGSSKASSTHFGFKHFEDHEESMSVVDYTGTTSTDAEEDNKYEITEITDDSQAWIKDELVGKSLQWTNGPLNNEIRPILVNSYNTVTVKGYYSETVVANTTYKILGTEWKGGKFCWDCHDPHGDSNLFMIQDDISVKTDGLFGKPLEKAEVAFTRTMSGMDYAKNNFPYNGICNVCHTNVDHYLSDSGSTHRSGRRCTTCHNHGFDEGHGSGDSCNSCHEQKPVPNHLGFGQPRDCTKCHDGVIKKRTDIMRQFRGQSHHVQGVEIDNTHCYQCHWEATEDGLINNDYHAGYNYKTHEAVSGSRNDMVVWQAEGRPDRYVLNDTAIIFNTASIGTGLERENVKRVTTHCLGCHSEQHNDTDVFGDCKTPRQYAWDRTSIAERYLDEGVTNWGKYQTFANAAKKIQDKAFSAHGNAVNNKRGWDPVNGEDEALPNDEQAGENVQCYDCHNSHGSYTKGITSSYKTFDNTYNGANLKETQAGKGGYNVTYQALEIEDGAGVVNPMNPGAAQCFDCHETRTAGALPWGYNSTFGAPDPIQSYRDSSRFAGGDDPTGHRTRFEYRSGMRSLGGHLKAYQPLDKAAAKYPINGLCSGCHDPHGVSPSLGKDMPFAVPLLKGTWLTSPYKDDKPFLDPDPVNRERRDSNHVQIDRKAFGTADGSSMGTPLTIIEDAETFAGLCLRCHPKENLTVEYDPDAAKPAWKSVDRVHQTVKGWGSNAEHSFPCAKCHNAHSSGRGRLMRTNCLNVKHRGQEEEGGFPGYYSTSQGKAYPRIAYYDGGPNWWPECHSSAEAGGGAWDDQEWNMVTPW